MRWYPVFLALATLFRAGAAAAQIHTLPAGAYAYPNSSTTLSDDTTGLSFIDRYLSGKRIVFLGEEDHKISEFNYLKTNLIRYLARKHSFDVVLFESPMDAALYGFAPGRKVSPAVSGDSFFLFPTWSAAENGGIMDDAASGMLQIYGMDCQTFTSYHRPDRYRQQPVAKLLQHAVLPPGTAEKLFALDSQMYACLRIRDSLYQFQHTPDGFKIDYTDTAGVIATCKTLQTAVAGYRAAIDESIPLSDPRSRLLRRCLQNRLWYAAVDLARYTRSRDSMMAENIVYIADSVFPGKRILVWAHDGHIAKQPPGDAGHPTSIGKFLPDRIRQESYVISLKMNTHVKNDGSRVIKSGRNFRRTLHYDLDQLGAAFFADVSEAGQNKLLSPLYKRTYSSERYVVPAGYAPLDVYDAVFYIRTTHTSRFASKNIRE